MAELIAEFGFPIVAMVGLGYFVYYVWRTMIGVIGPAIKEMHFALIKLIDQIRMLDNDMIRLDTSVSAALDLNPDLDRIARAENFVEDGSIDVRRD